MQNNKAMKTLTRDPKTTIGGLIALAAVFGLLAHKIDINAAVVILGVGTTLLGVVAKDGGTPVSPTVVTTAVTDSAGAKTTAVTTTQT